jgi:hypothetical protein
MAATSSDGDLFVDFNTCLRTVRMDRSKTALSAVLGLLLVSRSAGETDADRVECAEVPGVCCRDPARVGSTGAQGSGVGLRMTPLAGNYGRATAPIAGMLVATLCFLGAAAPARAASTRYAVPGGSASDANCTSTGANCSLAHVLQDVVQAGDEVIVTPGTHDVGSMGAYIKTGATPLNIHGQDGQPRPRVTATSTGFVLRMCVVTTCAREGTIVRYLAIENLGTGGALGFFGGAVGSPVTIDDVHAIAGSAGLAILGFAQTGVTSEAVIRDTTAYATGTGINGSAITSDLNLTIRNVTAVATGSGSVGLLQLPNCNDGVGCTGDATTTVFNAILAGGPGGSDVRANSSTNMCGTCFGNVSLDYSNFDSVVSCSGCSISPAGSAHNQTASPLLVNEAGGDFHELSGSPTIDAGVDDPANGSTDPDGNPRKLGPATDIGAFESGRPLVVTEPATNVTLNGATLRGSVNPFGLSTTFYFQWGATTAYGNRIPATDQSAGNGTGAQAVSQDLAGLTPGTTVHYRVVAANSFGTVFANDQSFTTLVPGQSLDRTRPSISSLSLTHRRFRVASKSTPVSARTRAPLATTFRYSLSERARVTITIDRALPGRRVGRSCRKPTRSNRTRRRCTRYVRAGTLTRRNKGPGRVSTAFSGRIGRRKLALGSYRATVGATDAAGNRAKTQRVSFSVVR